MSRRRQKNPMLGRILAISIAAHAVALPILSHFGALKKLERSLGINQVIVVPPPPKEKTTEQAKKSQKAAAAQKSKEATRPKAGGPKSNLNQPKVVASNAPVSEPGDANPTVDPNGDGKAGVVPTTKSDGGGKSAPGQETPTPLPEPVSTPPAAKPVPKPIDVPPVVEPKEKPPVFTEALVLSQPAPEIPDDLRADALEAECITELSVLPDGTVGSAKVVRSSGNSTLDQLALDAARKWRFQPATRDGEPIMSRVRLHIQYEVK